MIFLQTEPIPNTVDYMIAGYAVIFIVLAVYLISLAVRSRSAERDLEMLHELEEKENQITGNAEKQRKSVISNQ